MARDDESFFAAAQPKPAVHVVGEALDALSVDELDVRIAALHAEIARLEAARTQKAATRAAADAFFRRPGD